MLEVSVWDGDRDKFDEDGISEVKLSILRSLREVISDAMKSRSAFRTPERCFPIPIKRTRVPLFSFSDENMGFQSASSKLWRSSWIWKSSALRIFSNATAARPGPSTRSQKSVNDFAATNAFSFTLLSALHAIPLIAGDSSTLKMRRRGVTECLRRREQRWLISMLRASRSPHSISSNSLLKGFVFPKKRAGDAKPMCRDRCTTTARRIA